MTLSVQEIWQHVRVLSQEEQQILLQRLLAERRAMTSNEEWAQFIAQTYGSLSDDPLQLSHEGEFEEREPLL